MNMRVDHYFYVHEDEPVTPANAPGYYGQEFGAIDEKLAEDAVTCAGCGMRLLIPLEVCPACLACVRCGKQTRGAACICKPKEHKD
jgi:hypothetical protein